MMRPIFGTCLKQVLTILCLMIGCLSVQSQVKVFAAFDNSKILIGDHANLHLEASYPSDHSVTSVDLSVLDSIFAEVDPSKGDPDPGMLEVLSQTEWETIENTGNVIYRKDITLTCWKEGVYFIPQIRFNITFKGSNFSRATNRLNLLVSSPIEQTAAVDTVQIAPIKEIIEEEWRLSDFLPIVYFLLGSILIIGGIIFLILYIIRKKQGPPPIEIIVRPAHEIAFHKLNDLKNQTLWQNGEVKAYQSQLTYISREYIENRYDIPALESTTGTILKDLKKVEFPNDLVEKMREMLQLADMVKFAKANPPEEMNTRLMAYAEEIVEKTKLELSEEELQKLKSASPGTEETIIASTIYASSGKRFLAYLIDVVIFQILFGTVYFIISLFTLTTESGAFPSILIILSIVAYFLAGFFYYAYFHATKKKTFGKHLLGIELVQADGKNISFGKACLRFFIKSISFIFLFLPFLPILFNKQKQALHDMVPNTIVIRK